LGGIHLIKHNLSTDFFLLLFVEYLAWFIGWNYALLYQLGASAVVVHWSKYVVQFINDLSHCNVTSSVVEPCIAWNVTRSVVEAPWGWNETALSFYSTGQLINLPAITIIIAITLLLISGIRPTDMVNLVLVIITIITILIFIFACCKHVDINNYKPFFPPNEGK
jgi:APA family basic amino acid/polyamine antiporter